MENAEPLTKTVTKAEYEQAKGLMAIGQRHYKAQQQADEAFKALLGPKVGRDKWGSLPGALEDLIWDTEGDLDEALDAAGVTVGQGPSARDKLRDILGDAHTSPAGFTELSDEACESLFELLPQ